MRQNPYPYYESCEEAFEELQNLFFPILDLQRDIFLKNVNDWLDSDSAKDYIEDKFYRESLEELIQLCKQSESLEELRFHFDTFSNFLYDFSFLFPIYFLTKDVKVEENVCFVHVFPSQRLDSIKKEGFYGRATPSKMTLTRQFEDFYIKDNGYIFAYGEDDWSEDSVVQASCGIIGTAKKAMSFYFMPDKERQLIIPLKCIETYSVEEDYFLDEFGGDEFIDEWAFHPLKHKFSKK